MQRYYLCTFQTVGETPFLEERLIKTARSAMVAGAIAFTKVLMQLSQLYKVVFQGIQNIFDVGVANWSYEKTEFNVLNFRLKARCLYVVLYGFAYFEEEIVKGFSYIENFSGSLTKWAKSEDSVGTFRILFCLPESSFEKMYGLLESPMQFPNFWK